MVWYGVGLLCYLLGTVLVCVLLVDVLLSPADLTESLSGPGLLALVAGTGLLVLGRVILRKVGDERTGRAGVPGPPNRRPEPTTLERLGYHNPPDTDDGANREFGVGDDDSLVCDECGARNERGFDYCRNCSAELPA